MLRKNNTSLKTYDVPKSFNTVDDFIQLLEKYKNTTFEDISVEKYATGNNNTNNKHYKESKRRLLYY